MNVEKLDYDVTPGEARDVKVYGYERGPSFTKLRLVLSFDAHTGENETEAISRLVYELKRTRLCTVKP